MAVEVEMAIGGWFHEPEGDIAYKAVSALDVLDIERNLGYDNENRLMGRFKVDIPAPWPSIYVMASAMNFDGIGRKDVNFKFGDRIYTANQEVTSSVDLDHLDIGLYWSIPGVKRASSEKFNLEFGLNVRVVGFDAEATQPATGITESESFTVGLPMLYAGAQIEAAKWLAFEAEFRGITIDDDHMYGLIGRVKFRPVEPMFIAAGWRYEDLDVDEEDVRVDVSVSGPFAEVGVEF
jgi:outer membrane protein